MSKLGQRMWVTSLGLKAGFSMVAKSVVIFLFIDKLQATARTVQIELFVLFAHQQLQHRMANAWKLVANTLDVAANCMPPPASTALGLMSKLASLTCSALEASEVSKKNQQLIGQLSERALIVSRMIELYVQECRPQDNVFTTFVSSFHGTMVDVLGFSEKFVAVHQGWIQKEIQTLLHGSEVQSEFADLWRRLDALGADYRTYLLHNMVSKGPSERIEHPQLRGFWSQSMKDILEAKWVHFWDQLQYNFPGTLQFLSGPTASKNKEMLQARAVPRDPKLIGPWEINNLFQPPQKSVEQIISTVLAGDVEHLAAEPGAGLQRIPSDGSTRAAREVQSWTGYWTQGSHRGVMTLEIFFGANHRISGGGSDEVGLFTITGEHGGTQVNFTKQYIGKHEVQYEGEIRNNTVNGTWTIHSPFCEGSFHLEQKTRRSVANGVEAAIVQIGEMHYWTGYFEQQGRKSNMSGDLLFTDTHNIYGSGVDYIGRFTWLGRYQQQNHSTLVKMMKQYGGQHAVLYMGAIGHPLSLGQEDLKVVMEGSWVISENSNEGKFSLKLDEKN